MHKQFLLDAVETASNIHKGDFSSLRGKSFVTCDNMKKKRRGKTVKKPNEEKMTLAKLAKIVSDGFAELKQDIKDINARLDRVEERLDKVEARLDRVEERLDYNGLQIERIEKRLDYNNLKRLPD